MLSLNDNNMASNRFFSGRIPNELYEQAEKHCKETGDSKTEVLIKALSTYLDFPITIPGKNIIAPNPEVTKEMFLDLQERVKTLEVLTNNLQLSVIESNNTDNNHEEIQNINDNILDNIDNKTDNSKAENENPSVIESNNNSNNKDLELKGDEYQIPEITPELPKFEEITTVEVVKKTKLTRSQIDYLMGKAIEKIRHKGGTIKVGKLLEESFEVIHKDGIKVNDNHYRLFYAGENSKERPVWNLIPDNAIYQDLITDSTYLGNSINKDCYQFDNNSTKEETLDSLVQEQVEKGAGEQT
jgi:hypothetical protein